MDTKQYIAELLSRNLPPAQICQLANCTPAYISQLLSNPDFSSMVEGKRVRALQETSEQDSRARRVYDLYMDLEEKLLQDLTANLTLMRMGEKTRILHAISGKKAPPAPVSAPTAITQNLVQISLPPLAAQKFTMNSNKDIVALENKSLVPLDTTALKKLAAASTPLVNEIEKMFSSTGLEQVADEVVI